MAKYPLHHLLTEFYERCESHSDTAEQRLELLQWMADRIVVGRKMSDNRREKLRRKFVRRRKSDFAPMEPGEWRPCFVCWRAATHRHHVVMLNRGGDNRPRNVAWVCKNCHERIHPWMSQAIPTPLKARATKPPAPKVDALRTQAGGWTRKSLASLGVPWPPPKGWHKQMKQDMTPRLAIRKA